MAVSEKHILDLSGSGLKKFEKRDGVGINHLILDNNELTKLDNLEFFPDVEKLSASRNTLIRMYGVSKLHHLVHLNLSENNIICIEGIKELPNLNTLNLSSNSIKNIQNLQHSSNLTHLDLSKNSILFLADISNLVKLKTLHLNGNKISSLNHSSTYLPSSVCSLSLADNCFSDLNEISYLFGLHCLEQLTISGNPCVLTSNQLPVFDYRPFIVNWCLGLRLLDGFVVTQKESLKAEWLYSQGKGRHFKPGEHVELVEYLAQVCPLNSDQLVGEEDEKFTRILQMQRQHKEQVLQGLSQVHQPQTSSVSEIPKMSHSYHSKADTSSLNESKEPSKTSRIMYESAPEVLFHYGATETVTKTLPSLHPDKCSLAAKAELLHSSAKSPITIEQVVVDLDMTKTKPKDSPKTPYQHYEDRIVRPAARDGNINARSDVSIHSKGTPVRKVSKRATSPCTLSPSSGRSRSSHSPGVRSKLSPSRSCILQERCHTKSITAAKNSSESDTSEEHGQSGKVTVQNLKATLSPNSSSRNNSPMSRQKVTKESSSSSLIKPPLCFSSSGTKVEVGGSFPLSSSPFHKPVIDSEEPRVQSLAAKYNKTEDEVNKAAVKIQSVWRGHHVRHHNYRVFRLRQEVRFRRMEDHIQNLHMHLCRLTDFVLRQQQDLQHERELRKMQTDDITNLYEKAKELQKDVTSILLRRNSDPRTSGLQRLTEHTLFEASKHSYSRKDSLRDNALGSASCSEKALQDASPDFLTSSLQYSTQAFQENSGLFSPSSQTSSVISSGPETSFGKFKSCQGLPPSTSDMSETDSGLQSMVSPNLSAFLENERNMAVPDSESFVQHSISNLANIVSPFPSDKGIEELNSIYRHFGHKLDSSIDGGKSSNLSAPSALLSGPAKDILFGEQQRYGVLGNDSVLQSKLNYYQSRSDDSPTGHPMQRSAVSASGVLGMGNFRKSDFLEALKDEIKIATERASSRLPSDLKESQPVSSKRLSENFEYLQGESFIPRAVPLSSTTIHKPANRTSDPFLFSPLTSAASLILSLEPSTSLLETQKKSSLDIKHDEAHSSHESDGANKSQCNGCSVENHVNKTPTESLSTDNGCKEGNCSPVGSGCPPSAKQLSKPSCKSDSNCNLQKSETFSKSQVHPLRFNKGSGHGNRSKPSTPLEEASSTDSPPSPCTVEMSGRISHSCSFQSEGFTAAEELSAMATVKLFSTRSVSMTCSNGPQSPQSAQRPSLSCSDCSSQANVRSPLVIAASVWEKKVQDIESTFHLLQSQGGAQQSRHLSSPEFSEQAWASCRLAPSSCVNTISAVDEHRQSVLQKIRDLEGTFGQIGQFGQFFYPNILQDEVKEPRHVVPHLEPSTGTLILDMPKINFKRTDNSKNDLFFQTHFSGPLGKSIPFLPPPSRHGISENGEHGKVEELNQESQCSPDENKNLKLTLNTENNNSEG